MSLLPSRKDRQQPAAQPAIPPARRRISDGAAYFAQNIMDLENRCEELQRELAARDHQLSIQAVESQSLRAALRATDARLNYFERRAIQLETKLSTVVGIVVDCLDEKPPMPSKDSSVEKT